jgi:nicotinamidase-related amidase
VYKTRSERAIIALDMINYLANPLGGGYHPGTSDIIPFILGELNYFRERMRPVIFCNSIFTKTDGLNAEAVKFNEKIINQLSPREKEICLKKTRPNAFYNTELSSVLENLQVGTVTIVGIFTHTSVIATAGSALDLGLGVVIPEPCVCSRDTNAHNIALSLVRAWTKGHYYE